MPAKDRTQTRAIPQQERARASVVAILSAAEEVLAERGLEGATTNRIAARAGVNVGLLYRYFAGKEAILGALIDRAAEATETAFVEAIARTRGAAFRDRVRALLEAVTHEPSSALHRTLVEHVETARRGPVLEALRARLVVHFSSFLAEHASELRELDDRAASLFLLQHLLEASTHAAAFYRPPTLSADRVLDALTDLVVGYLVRR